MPPKKKIAQPIDRPLSKAFLREFAGWSTVDPPGISEPNSLRLMENVQITRTGAARVRPGLRSYLDVPMEHPLVGSHEVFYTEQGKAYLIAVRVEEGTVDDVGDPVGRIEFRVILHDADGAPYVDTLANAGFELPADAESISFGLATTYVKYVQVDNKIFALANTDEPMIMFWVGEERKAKRLQKVDRPEWTVEDKLTALHPDASWILGGDPLAVRRNRCPNPSFEKSTTRWSPNSAGKIWRSATPSLGGFSLGMQSLPSRTNYCEYPLHNVGSTGLTGWDEGTAVSAISVSGSAMRVQFKSGKDKDTFCRARSVMTPVTAGMRMRLSFQLVSQANLRRWQTGVRFYKSNGDAIGDLKLTGGNNNFTPRQCISTDFVIPDQAVKMRMLIGGYPTGTGVTGRIDVKNVYLGEYGLSYDPLDGDDGAGHYWTGSGNGSTSVEHGSRDIAADMDTVPATVRAGKAYIASVDLKSQVPRSVDIQIRAWNADSTIIGSVSTRVTSTTSFATYSSAELVMPAGTTKADMRVVVRAVPRGESHWMDKVLLEEVSAGAGAGTFFHGSTEPDPEEVGGSTVYKWTGAEHESQSLATTYAAGATTAPAVESATSKTLVSSNADNNLYNFGFFYTVANEVGESAESKVTVIKTQRPWSSWKWQLPDPVTGEPGAETITPALCADQLTVSMPQEVFAEAVDSKATHWYAYFFTWGPNEVQPITATRFAKIDLSVNPDYSTHGWARLTPEMVSLGTGSPVVPTEQTRVNSTDPSRGTQGMVMADRLVLVGDPSDPARISWASGQPGAYYDFSPLKGGGSKQLPSGNLFLTAAVVLWQNPQSVDTITVLNRGDDGRSNAWYMQPATITSLSESISVMGFEEVSHMPGTSSPYACEVVNNALYHPLEQHILKSTSNNYNLNHKAVTDLIENMWQSLQDHRGIVSSQLDNRIYYLVHNYRGEALEAGCSGNEVWVLDVAAKSPTWSRWKVQGVSLRTLEVDNSVMMSVVRPDGIFTFDPTRYNDEVFDEAGVLQRVNIRWFLETNTQGANRAHDAWCFLQQANVTFGNFEGQLRYGIRGKDVNGMDIDIVKEVLAEVPPADGLGDETVVDETAPPLSFLAPFDREDFFLVRKVLKEWVFYAGSVDDLVETSATGDEESEVYVPRYSAGQINYVQYRYTPISVNVGYEYGSVETFEYSNRAAATTTDSGTPKPYIDMARP